MAKMPSPGSQALKIYVGSHRVKVLSTGQKLLSKTKFFWYGTAKFSCCEEFFVLFKNILCRQMDRPQVTKSNDALALFHKMILGTR